MNTSLSASGGVYLSRSVAEDLLDELDTCLCLVSPASTIRIGVAVDLLARLRGKLAAAFTASAPHALRQARAEGVREGFALAEEYGEVTGLASGDYRPDLAEAQRQRDRLLHNLGAEPSGPGMIPTRPVYHLDAADLMAAMVRVYILPEKVVRVRILGADGRYDGHSWVASALPGLTRDKPLTAESLAPGMDVELDEILSDLTDRGELPAGGGDYLVR